MQTEINQDICISDHSDWTNPLGSLSPMSPSATSTIWKPLQGWGLHQQPAQAFQKKHHLILLFSCFSGFVPITSCFIFQDSQCSFTFPVPKTSLLFFPLVKQGCFIQFPSCISLPLFHHLCDPFCRARSAAVPGKCREQGTPVSPGVCHTWHPESRISRETGTGAGAGESRGDWRADRTSSSWESTEMQ